MSEPKRYLLQMLFDSEQIDFAELEARVRVAISSQASRVDLKIEVTPIGPVMSLEGSLQDVDECHDQINTSLLSAEPLPCVRLVDEAGDEVRKQAYPILSSIEQHLRAFVNRKAVEVLGFGWWNRYAPIELQNKVNSYVKKDAGVTLLEGTQFNDLVDLITHEYSQWPSDKVLSVSELNELMAGCNSFEDFQAHLAAQTARFSLWDKVFAPYFDDSEQWKKVKSELKFIIKERHKVMHHRPMRLITVAMLATKEQEITKLLGASKITLAESEREKVQQEVEQVLPAYEKAHRAEVARLFAATDMSVEMERFGALFSTMRDDGRHLRLLQEALPDPQKLAATHKALLATLPSESELKRTLEQIQASLPTPEQARTETERTSRMLKHVLDQSESLLAKTRMHNLIYPDQSLFGQVESIQKNLAPVKAAWEQLQRHRGR